MVDPIISANLLVAKAENNQVLSEIGMISAILTRQIAELQAQGDFDATVEFACKVLEEVTAKTKDYVEALKTIVDKNLTTLRKYK